VFQLGLLGRRATAGMFVVEEMTRRMAQTTSILIEPSLTSCNIRFGGDPQPSLQEALRLFRKLIASYVPL
jgi:hypothetical protein